MFWRRRPAVEVEPVKPEGLTWVQDGNGGFVAYPEIGLANWERYSVSQDETTGFWVPRWQMHRMNSVIGWFTAPEDAMAYASAHHDRERQNTLL